ncbi:hypothetical protein [Cohnella sp. AR92]|uniref:hypothetical protein n=1 Tax=Cohnella sp. AR92 TaxID=648716 RepID=UPI000F8E34D4|nr:hypothetical protein [Cohnella sp. AR92]RUS48852.1 hypothetical protein ELR57_00430 [Cohnella sp. AR92]
MRNESLTLYEQDQVASIRFAPEDMQCRILKFSAPYVDMGGTVLFADVKVLISKYEDSDGIIHISPFELTVSHIRLVKCGDDYDVELPDDLEMDSSIYVFLKSTLSRCYEEHFERSII